MNLYSFLLILLNTLLLVIGQFLWKFGMTKRTYDFGSTLGIIKLLVSPHILGGLILYGIATIIWLFILSKVPLSIAYPLQSIAYLITIFGAYFIFGEQITIWKIAGVLLIMLGVSMIGFSEIAVTKLNW